MKEDEITFCEHETYSFLFSLRNNSPVNPVTTWFFFYLHSTFFQLFNPCYLFISVMYRALYGYANNTNDLKLISKGPGGLDELADQFDESKILYAFARVIDPNTELTKFIFINWVSISFTFLSLSLPLSGWIAQRTVFFDGDSSLILLFLA